MIIFYLIFSPLFFIIGCIFGRGLMEWKEDDLKGYIRPYILEALGDLFGGIFFSLIIIRFLNFQLRYYFVYITIFLIFILKEKKKIYLIILILLYSFPIPFIIKKSLQRDFAGYKFNNLIDTRYNRFIVREKENIKSVYIDGKLSFSYPVGFYDEMQHLPFLLKDSFENEILSIGIPSPSECLELLKEGKLTIIEQNKEIKILYPDNINWIFTDPFKAKIEDKYDFIIVNAGLPDNITSSRFFSVEFLKRMKIYLKDDGFIILKIPSSDVYIDTFTKDLDGTLLETGNSVFKYSFVFPLESGIFIFSDKEIKIDEKIMIEKLEKLKLNYLNEGFLRYIIERSQFFYERMKGNFKVSTIKEPYIFYLFLKYNSFKFKDFLLNILKIFDKIPYYLIIFFFILPFIKRNVLYNVSIVGFLGITSEIIVLFLFQSYNGTLYQYVGAIIGFFMFGVGMGGAFFEKFPRRYYLILVYIFFFFIFVYLLLPLRSINLFSASLLNLFAGFSVGLTYGCSTFITGEGKKEAAKVYFYDLIGASIGSFFTSIILIPVYGVKKTLVILIAISIAGFISRINR